MGHSQSIGQPNRREEREKKGEERKRTRRKEIERKEKEKNQTKQKEKERKILIFCILFISFSYVICYFC